MLSFNDRLRKLSRLEWAVTSPLSVSLNEQKLLASDVALMAVLDKELGFVSLSVLIVVAG